MPVSSIIQKPNKGRNVANSKYRSPEKTLPREGYFFTEDDLKYLQSLPLEQKVAKTQSKLIEWCLHWKWQVYLSFSGGKDSTVLLDLLRRVTKVYERDVPAVFCDTGLEYPEIRKFVDSHENVCVIKPEQSFLKVVKEHGYPVISKDVSQMISGARRGVPSSVRKINGLDVDSRANDFMERRYGFYRFLLDAPFPISDKCCDILKKKPFHKYEKETGRKCITAMMAHESMRRKESYLRNGCNAFRSKRPISNPMGFWTEQDVLRYLSEFNVPFAPVYGTIIEDEKTGMLRTSELDRTGCIFCMFGVRLERKPNRFQRMKDTHPKLYDYCLDKIGCREVLEFIGVDYK